MNTEHLHFVSVEMLIRLANIAAASVIVCAVALLFVRVRHSACLPIKHAVLTTALIATLASPLIVALAQKKELSFFTVDLGDRSPATPAPHTEPGFTLPAPQFANDEAIYTTTTTNKPFENQPTALGLSSPNTSTLPAALSAPPGAKAKWSWPQLITSLGRLLAFIWAGGCVWKSCQLASGLLLLRKLINRLQPVKDAEVARLCVRVAQQLGLRHTPRIYESHTIQGPLSLGIFRPVIVLPATMKPSFGEPEMRGMLLHELAHIVRRDHLVGTLQRIALVVFWWNPLLHQISRQISALREQICDDLATRDADSAETYASMLVELASRVTARRPIPATLGIFEGDVHEFTGRVRRLLDHDRTIVTGLDRRMKLATAGTLAALIAVMVATSVQVRSAQAGNDPPAAKSNTSEAEKAAPTEKAALADSENLAPALKWGKVLRGKIKNEKGKPLAGVKVRFDLKVITEFPNGREEKTIHTATLVTGDNGEYRFDTSKLPALTHRPFVNTITCAADGYAEAKTWSWYSKNDTSVGEHFIDLKMAPGRIVRGRCVDPDGRPVANAAVKIVAADDSKHDWSSNFNWDPRKTDGDGMFEVSVPRDPNLNIEMWIAHPDWAPQNVVIPTGIKLDDIRLEKGGEISGTVLFADGKPAAGVSVAAESVFSGKLKDVAFGNYVATKTDAGGRYRLPPVDGEYKVYLSYGARNDADISERYLVSDVPPPLVVPERVKVSDGEPQTVDFRGSETATIRGTARWPDDKPVAGMEVRAYYLPHDNGTSVQLAQTVTDKDGKYSVVVPRPIDSLSIGAIGQNDAKHKWYYARGETNAEVENQGLQFIGLKHVDEDIDDVNWRLTAEPSELKERKPDEPDKPTGDAAELQKLDDRYEAAQRKFIEAHNKAKTDEERQKLDWKLDPRSLFVDDYLKFEEAHRGSDAGLMALHRVEQFARTVGDMMPKVPAARLEVIRRLLAHYLDHADLDVMFTGVDSGPQPNKFADLLNRAATESPHRHVQAAARYYQGINLSQWADAADELEMMKKDMIAQSPPNQAAIDHLDELKKAISTIDSTTNRAEAVRLCDQILRDYADVREPSRIFSTGSEFHRAAEGQVASGGRSYKALADGLKFNLEHAQIGQPAPKIVGKDRAGKPVEVSDYQGKVTVIRFQGSGPSSMDDTLAVLAADTNGENLFVVTICSDARASTVPADSKIVNPNWVEIAEPTQGPLLTQWSIRTWPTVFVVDKHGRIRSRRLPTLPSELVGELLADTTPSMPFRTPK